MNSILYVYDIKNLKSMQETLVEFHFSSIAHFIHINNTVEELSEMDASDIANTIIDITNLIKDGTYYRIFTERYLRTLSENFENIHFSLQTNCLESFRERFPYLFEEKEINYDFQTVESNDVIQGKEIEIHPPLSLYVYKNQATIKKLYKDGWTCQ